MNLKLSLIIPAFNELKNFRAGRLQQVEDYLQKKKLDWQVIVVDDVSTDGSPDKIQAWIKNKKNWHLIRNPHQGKAAAVAAGVSQAQAPYVLFTDFDQATPLAEVEKLLPFVKKGYKIVIGSREVKGSLRQKEPWYRHLMGKVFNLVVKVVAVSGIHDTQCGFKLFATPTARRLFSALKVYRPKPEKHAFTGAFDVELLYIANKWGIKIAEVPITWFHQSTTRVNPIRDSIRMFFHVLKIRLTDIFGGYR
jgi:glycosyltransferase involved in cell wall biosynthesis